MREVSWCNLLRGSGDRSVSAARVVDPKDGACPTCKVPRGHYWGTCPDQWHRAFEAWSRPAAKAAPNEGAESLYLGIGIDQARCAACAAYPDLPCADHRPKDGA